MTFTKLKQAIAQTGQAIDALQEQRGDLLQQLADRHAQHKAGELVIVPSAAYVHCGKLCQIERVFARVGFKETLEIHYRASVCTKDGKPGKCQVRWSHSL